MAADPDVVLVAVRLEDTAEVVNAALTTYVRSTVIDTASIKARPLHDVERSTTDLTRYVPTHPIAGSERRGAAAARADLFRGRTWVLCPHPALDGAHRERAAALIQDTGASPLVLDARTHDVALAATSHLPQVVASSLAAVVGEMLAAIREEGSYAALDPASVSGPALLDMTRVAASPSGMWAAVAAGNDGPLLAALDRFLVALRAYRDGLVAPGGAAAATLALLEAGGAARGVIAAKHGSVDRPHPTRTAAPATARPPAEPRIGAAGQASGWAWVEVVVSDEPGALARLFATAAGQGINIEDLHVDHAPHATTGVVSLAVRAADASRLRAAFVDRTIER